MDEAEQAKRMPPISTEEQPQHPSHFPKQNGPMRPGKRDSALSMNIWLGLGTIIILGGAILVTVLKAGWLNSNQGAVMGLLTFVYVAATVALVYFTRKNIDVLTSLEQERSRPRVLFSIEGKTSQKGVLIFARLKNFGGLPGFKVNTYIEPTLLKPSQGEMIETVFTAYELSFLGPNEEELDALTSGHEFVAENGDKVFNVTVQYQDSTERKYEETQVFGRLLPQ